MIRKRLGVMCSGNGTNFENIVRSCKEHEVVLMIHNTKDCGASKRASKFGIPHAYFNHNEEISVQAHSVGTIDTTAAGDTYVGYYISTLTKKIGIKECMEKATKAAGITTEKIGGAISIPTID